MDAEQEFLKAVNGDFGRNHCPKGNVGHIFGQIGFGLLEGFLDSPNYCIVENGQCSRHRGAPIEAGLTGE